MALFHLEEVTLATRDSFSKEQLSTIELAPVLVIAAAAASEPGEPATVVKEMVAGIGGLAESLQHEPSALVSEFFQHFDDQEFDLDEIFDSENPQIQFEVIERSLPQAREAYELILGHSGRQDADSYAHALLTAAQAAIFAAKERRFLGFGGESETDTEAVYLSRLADALGEAGDS